MLGDAGAFPECEVIHQLHPIASPSRCTALCRVESVFLERPLHGTPREGSCSLSMQPVGCTPWTQC